MLPASPSLILHFSLLKSSHMLTVPPKRNRLRWESTVAVGAAGLTTLAIKYPLDIVQTRFEVNDRRLFSQFPKYNGTVHAIFTIARTEVSLCMNPFTVVKTRLQLQTPLHQARPYSGIYDAFRTIKREEGFSALYRGIVPGLVFAAHITVYEKLRITVVNSKTKGSTIKHQNPDKILNSVHYVALGAITTVAATLPIHPFHLQLSPLVF